MNDFKPNWISPPGNTIQDVMVEKGITKRYFSQLLEMTLTEVDLLLTGELVITRKIATKLAKVLGASQNFWFNREQHYRKEKIRLGL